MMHIFQLDPAEVLGVPPQASLEMLREAYRAKSRRYHPDVGGDAWAFRILTRCYELLCQARVQARADEELRRGMVQRPPGSSEEAPAHASARSTIGGDSGFFRPGATDSQTDPARRVAVEMLLLRFEVQNPMELMSLRSEDRNLSCTLHLQWPPEGVPGPAPRDAATIIKALQSVFKTVQRQARPISSDVHVEGDQFSAWLSYPDARRADAAFKHLRAALQERGLGVDQKIRDVTIPRDWR